MGVPFDTDELEGEVVFSAFETDQSWQLVVTVPAGLRLMLKTWLLPKRALLAAAKSLYRKVWREAALEEYGEDFGDLQAADVFTCGFFPLWRVGFLYGKTELRGCLEWAACHGKAPRTVQI